VSKPAVALLRRDLRVTRVLWAPMAFSYFAFLLMFMHNIWVYLATGACLAFVAAATVPAIDDRYQTDPLFAALPGTRLSLVAGRYLAWGVFTIVCLAFFLASTAAIHAGFGDRIPRLGSLLSLKGTAAFLAGTSLAGLIFLPLHFRLGYWRAMWVFTVAGLVISAAGLNILGGLAPGGAEAAAGPAQMPSAFASTARGLRALAGLIDRDLGRPDVGALLAVIIALLLWLSYQLSVRFYEKRDL
jgi:hypothetical protein